MSTCPSCEEPLESGDRFCGACGYDLSAVPAPPDDLPTVTLSTDGAAPAQTPAVDWPSAPELDSSDTPAPVHLPTDLPGTDSGGSELPSAVRFDGVPEQAGESARRLHAARARSAYGAARGARDPARGHEALRGVPGRARRP